MTDSTLSTAIKEAYASAPTDEIIYHTLEIWHDNFSVPIRIVRDTTTLTATLESSAPRNPSASVNFTAFAFDIVPPEVTHTAVPQCIIEIDNVSRDIVANIELAMGSTDKIEVIYRAFLSGNLASGPENDPPLTMTIMAIHADVFRVRATAGFGDLSNMRFPGVDYLSETFPGLIAQ